MKKVIDGGKIMFSFDADAAGVKPADVVFDSSKCSTTVKNAAVMHGFSARIGDNAALSRKQKDGSVIVITEQMRRDAVLELVNHYESGAENWDVKRGPSENPTIRALADKLGGTYAQAEAYIQEKMLAGI